MTYARRNDVIKIFQIMAFSPNLNRVKNKVVYLSIDAAIQKIYLIEGTIYNLFIKKQRLFFTYLALKDLLSSTNFV